MTAYDMMPCTDRSHVSKSNCRIAHKRLAGEATALRYLIEQLKQAGWTPISTFDGGEHVKGTTEKATLDTVFSVDESTITFQKGDERHGVLIVLGNSPGEVVADYGMAGGPDAAGWNALMDRVCDEMMEKYDV